MPMKCFPGPGNFRVKLALSLITLRPISITQIRNKSLNPGVDAAEVSLLKLIDEVSNGTEIKISDTGTTVTCKPGILVGGTFTFECCGERGLGYFIEFLLLIAPFCKQPINATLMGVTNSSIDPSPDMIKQAWFPAYRELIGPSAAAALELTITKRGTAPNGGGEIVFSSKPCTGILPMMKLNEGKVYRIRGVAWTCRVNSGYGHKLMSGAKSLLNRLLSDVYVTLDHRKDESAGRSPGFGITLWAETKEGAVYSAEAISEPETPSAVPVDAEAVGKSAASHLLDEIYNGGFVDSGAQSLILFLMACEAGRNASQLAIGSPTSYTVATLQLIQEFLGVTFHFDYRNRLGSGKLATQSEDGTSDPPDHQPEDSASLDSDVLIATCFGAGIKNVARAVR
ncbi:hypothetical protein T265_05239 [Opisthorchis viverrini]|uniref:18S rRNA biogenesis protein RCL1 n=1 Tax=Opisthorchis viverrini TaxID=6198 RepID=A0A074ZK97_OPIVI|nr:hypothetical protein T265_05239 [Opisthorchis viverrini]KER27748.1 hypothetical protein T265_05239 [Opisthorchis viverrini]